VYLSYIDKLRKDEVLPGAREFLEACRTAGIPVALGSASKNSRKILDKLELTHLFDAIIDGTVVSAAKPDPEVFVKAAQFLGEDPANCIVVEDAFAGIDAAKAAGMTGVGIGDAASYEKADHHIRAFSELLDL
jgi:beta-phosphoglucomutase